MDFVRLGAPYTTTYVPDRTIEGYNSLIWTERFQSHGEFELKSYDVEGLEALLKEGTLVSHLETREVMRVETREINLVGEGADAVPEITIRGRSAAAILEERWVESSYKKKRRMRLKYTPTAAAAVLLFNAIDNASGADVTRGDTDPETELVLNSYPWTTADVLPNIAITESVSAEGAARWWQLEEGILYPQLMKILASDDLGLRLIRPSSPSPGLVVTVKTALSERGSVIRTSSSDIPQLQFNVYSGSDKSASVKFSLLQGHLEKVQELFSSKDHRTGLEIMSDEVQVGDVYLSGDAGRTGWQRRMAGFDAGSPEIPPQPDKPDELGKNATRAQREARADAMDVWIRKNARWKNKRNNIVSDFREEVVLAAQKELKRQRRVEVLSGDVSPLSPYIYKTHYDLGDTVTLVGRNNLEAKMVVSEFVRTDDVNGDRGFPGLVSP